MSLFAPASLNALNPSGGEYFLSKREKRGSVSKYEGEGRIGRELTGLKGLHDELEVLVQDPERLRSCPSLNCPSPSRLMKNLNLLRLTETRQRRRERELEEQVLPFLMLSSLPSR